MPLTPVSPRADAAPASAHTLRLVFMWRRLALLFLASRQGTRAREATPVGFSS